MKNDSMQIHTLTVRFLTPAFLGDAEQKGAWRTPPFKAQLRQWWRLAQAADGRGCSQIRAEEAKLFGNAWPDQQASRSEVRLRLDSWRRGNKQNCASHSKLSIMAGGNSINAAVYLGYGPVKTATALKEPPAIDAGEQAALRIAAPQRYSAQLDQVIALMHRFGTVGGRSRNGWGAYALDGAAKAEIRNYLIDWEEALQEDWVRGIGKDQQGPLIWRTQQGFERWEEAMQALAQVRADVNRLGRSDEERCLLSYPVTRKFQRGWRDQDRLPNSLRFKVIEQDGKLYGDIVHLPCRPSDELWRRASQPGELLRHAWGNVHQHLDKRPDLQRLGA